jgi:hypothetical protein
MTSLVTTAIEAIIGAGTGSEDEMSSYYIIVQDYGIVRYDVRAWARQIEAAGITTQIETALAITAYKSTVDVRKIDYNAFLTAYGGQLAAMGFPPDKQKEYLTYAREIFDQLRKEDIVDAEAPSITEFANFRCPGEVTGSLWR